MAIPPGAGRRAAVPPTRKPPRRPPAKPTPPRGPKVKPRPPQRPPGGGKRPPRQQPRGGGVGFDPMQMAQTLTDLGYDADIRAIEQAIAENARREAIAMSNIRDWTAQMDEQRARGSTAVGGAYQTAADAAFASNQQIANLFGEDAAGEALAGMQPGVDAIRDTGVASQAFFEHMAPILQAQGMDTSRRARGDFSSERRDLTEDMLGLRSDKSKAYKGNLLEMMNLKWQRENDLFSRRMQMIQSRQAQQAIDQASALAGPELTAAKLANQKTRQDMRLAAQQAAMDRAGFAEDAKMSRLQREQLAIANRRAQAELDKVLRGGADPLSPEGRLALAQAAISGSVNKNGVFMMNPRLALASAFNMLEIQGLADDPGAIQAVMAAFEQQLRYTHSRGAWKKWVWKNGKLIYTGQRGGRRIKGGAIINAENPQITLDEMR